MKTNILKRILCVFLAVSLLPLSTLTTLAASYFSTSYKVSLAFDPDDTYGVLELKSNSDRNVKQNSTTVKKGGSVELWATPQHPAVFEGWYDQDGNLLSTNLYHKLTNVTKNQTVTGKFGDIYTHGFHDNHDGFIAWTNPNAMPTEAGKYYLATDVTIDKLWEAPDGVVLCLNGHILRNTNVSAAITVNENCQVIITDCDTTTKHYFDQNGIGAWVLNDENTDSPFYVTGGVITGIDRCIYIYGGGVLYMCGGNAVGAIGDKNGPGVNVNDNGVFYMYGGTIQGNVNTHAGTDKGDQLGSNDGTVQEYNGGGGIFIDVDAYVYLGGDSVIANNTALYTNNGGGVYNYRGVLELDGNVRIENNRGANGAASNYQGYQYRGVSSMMYVYDYLENANIGVRMDAKNIAFSDYNYDDYSANFFPDDINKKITVDSDNYLYISTTSVDGYVVTAGTRGAGTATVNGVDGASGVVVSSGASATLVATPANEDYIFVGWYNQDGALITTNPTYTISSVKENKSVQAYFMLKDEPITVTGAGTVHVFSSGDDTEVSRSNVYDYRYKNPEFSTLDNGGRYLYFTNMDSERIYDEEGPVGLPFTINGKVLEKSVVTLSCYDVDESSNETDVVFLVDLTTHTRVELGNLTGYNNKWTNTSFTIAPELLQEGHTYQLYLENQTDGWCTWVDTASISIGAMETQVEVVEPVTSASITGSISSNRKVSGELTLVLPETGTFDIEYKATHIATNNQVAYAFAASQAFTAPEGSVSYSFYLDSGSPSGAYRIDAYVLDAEDNVIKTVSCTAGYSAVTVTYHANGGTNNLPEDTNSYASGDKVTVKFDYTPSYVQTFSLVGSGAVFTGWSTDPEATVPEYTADGNNTFNIGSEDVTLYAVYHVHDYSETVTTPATCTASGLTQELCECGEVIYEEEIPATGHTMGEWVIDVQATDDTEGSKHQTCTVCGHTVTEVIPANGHTYTSVVVAPTCTEQGYTEHTCTNEGCGDSYKTDFADALGHTEEIIPAIPATCTSTGLTEGKKCSVCGVVLVEQAIVDALGHDYVTVRETPASCIEDGIITETCTHCGDTKTVDGASATGHDYAAVVTQPTCGSDGYTDYTCTVCGDAYRGDYVDATGAHVYGEPVVTMPTCVDDGYSEYTCTNVIGKDAQGNDIVCGHVNVTDETQATGDHDYVAIGELPNCTEGGHTDYTCNVCGHDYTEETPATGHTPGDEWIVDKVATAEEPGTKYKECIVCHAVVETMNYEIPKIIGEGSDLVLVANGYEIENVKLAFIGEETATVTTWKEFEIAKIDEIPLKYYSNVADATRWTQKTEGYYGYYIRTTEKEVFYGVAFASVQVNIPYIFADGGDFVMHASGYTIENVKLAYVGDESATVTNWKEFEIAKIDNIPLKYYSDVADETRWPQYKAGYYAYYIRTSEKETYYGVLNMENPYHVPYISAENENFVMHASGYTIENVKLAYMGAESATVTNWKEFEIAKIDDIPLKYYSNVADGTTWPQYMAGYYACYIRTTEIGVIYNVVYMENPIIETVTVPSVSVVDGKPVLNANGYTVDNVKLAYIGTESATVTNWDEFAAAKLDDVPLKYYSNVADATAFNVDNSGYYAVYIRYINEEGKKKVIYNVINCTIASVE